MKSKKSRRRSRGVRLQYLNAFLDPAIDSLQPLARRAPKRIHRGVVARLKLLDQMETIERYD